MRSHMSESIISLFIFLLVTLSLFSGCKKMSETIKVDSAGINGSFEHVESGLPVNWIMYTPNTVPDSDFEIVIDNSDFQNGKQSLKFVVRECSSVGGWLSPGFCQEYEATAGKSYKISFWIKNENSEFVVKIGGVSAKRGEYDTIVKTPVDYPEWTQFEHTYTMPAEFERLRIEVNVLDLGTFWIDNIEIEGISETALFIHLD